MSDILEFFESASKDSQGEQIDPIYLRSMSGNVQTNSGIQTVFPNMLNCKMLAQLIHWKFQPYAVEMAKNNEYGIFALSSESGNGVKSFNTVRQEQHFSSKNGTSQKPDAWDRYVYGKEKFSNNDEQ